VCVFALFQVLCFVVVRIVCVLNLLVSLDLRIYSCALFRAQKDHNLVCSFSGSWKADLVLVYVALFFVYS
jgi:hypothetical protein